MKLSFHPKSGWGGDESLGRERGWVETRVSYGGEGGEVFSTILQSTITLFRRGITISHFKTILNVSVELDTSIKPALETTRTFDDQRVAF